MQRSALEQLIKLEAKQFGVVAWSQLLALGVSPHFVERRVASGEWERTQLGVYRLRPGEWTLEMREMAALLGAGRGAVLSHQSAARKLGLDVPNISPICITIAETRRARAMVGVEIYRSRDLRPEDVVERGPFRVTSVLRTLVGLSEVLEDKWLRAAIDSSLRTHQATVSSLKSSLKALSRGRPSLRRLQKLLEGYDDGDDATGSRLESFAMELGLATGRKPRPQFPIRVSDTRSYKADLAWPELHLVIELDGYSTHSDRRAFERDRARDRNLLDAGWQVRRYVWNEVTADRQVFINELARVFAQRLGAPPPSDSAPSPAA